METHIPKPVIYIYKEINVGKFKSVKHYELQGEPTKEIELTKLINISEDRQFAKSSPLYWLKIHDGKKWVNPILTGLFKTELSSIFMGYVGKKEHLIVFGFIENSNTLITYYFKDYYTRHLILVIDQIFYL